jgi:hypothetical protein
MVVAQSGLATSNNKPLHSNGKPLFFWKIGTLFILHFTVGPKLIFSQIKFPEQFLPPTFSPYR